MSKSKKQLEEEIKILKLRLSLAEEHILEMQPAFLEYQLNKSEREPELWVNYLRSFNEKMCKAKKEKVKSNPFWGEDYEGEGRS